MGWSPRRGVGDYIQVCRPSTTGLNVLIFSENGYYVATASGGNEIKIWDLRKLKEIKSIKMREDDYVINSLRYE